MSKKPQRKTVDDFQRDLESQNVTVSQWARDKSLNLNVVFMVLQGRCLGYRGAAREVMQAMGINPPSRLDARKSRATKVA